jgi:hypothetical protein
MPNIFDQLHKEGKQLYEAKKYREARKSFSEALLLSPAGFKIRPKKSVAERSG